MDDAGEAPGGQEPQRFVDGARLLQTSLARYFNQPLFSDITVIGPDKRRLCCHQVVLSAGSRRFANMLEHGNLQGEELPVWGVDSDALQAIIEFFYTGECLLTFPGAVAVMDAATRLDVPSLATAAEAFVRAALAPTTAMTVLARALQFKMQALAASATELICTRFDAVAATAGFLAAPFAALRHALAAAAQHEGVTEEAVFRAAWRWVVADVQHPQHMEELLQLIKVPAGISFAELLQSGTGAVAGQTAMAAAIAAVAAAAGGHAQQPAGQQPAAAPAGAPAAAPAVAAAADGGDSQPPQQQQPAEAAASSWHGVTVTTGSAPPAPAAAAAAMAAAAAAAAAGLPAASDDTSGLLAALAAGSGLGLLSPSGCSLPSTSQPPGVASFDVLSGQPTPSNYLPPGGVGAAPFGVAVVTPPVDAAAAAAAPVPLGALSVHADPYAAAAAAAALYSSGAAGAASALHNAAAAASADSGGRSDSPSGGAPRAGVAWGTRSGGPAAHAASSSGGTGRTQHHAKGVCQVEGCSTDLKGLREYHLRYKICEHHLKISSIMRDGQQQRFCQQCGRFHPLAEFDGTKRSCRARLQRHNARRRKRGDEEPAAAFGAAPATNKRGRASASQLAGEGDDDGPGAAAIAAAPWPLVPAGGGLGLDPQNPIAASAAYMMRVASDAMAAVAAASAASGDMAAAFGPAAAGALPFAGQLAQPQLAGDAAADAAASRHAGARGARPPSAASTRGRGGGAWEGAQPGGSAEPDDAGWAAGLEMLADVAQARTSGGGEPGAGAAGAGSSEPEPSGTPAPAADQPEAPAAADQAQAPAAAEQAQAPAAAAAAGQPTGTGVVAGAGGQAQQPAADRAPSAEQDRLCSEQPPEQATQPAQHATPEPAANADPGAGGATLLIPPPQPTDSPSPHVGSSGGLLAGRASPSRDAHSTAPAAGAAPAAAGPSALPKDGSCAARAASAAARSEAPAAAGTGTGSDHAFRGLDAQGATAGTVRG